MSDVWQGRVDAEDGNLGRRWHQLVQPLAAGARAGVALVGFASDEGVRRNQGRLGAREGPHALRRALAPLAYHGTRDTPLYDAGDIACDGEDLEGAQRALGARVEALVAQGHFPVLLGGGHEMAWGSFQGASAALAKGGRLAHYGIVNFDAHFDLRRGRASSGTPFLQIHDALAAQGLPFRYLCIGISRAANTPALFDTARRCGATWLTDEDIVWPRWDAACRAIDTFVDSIDALQLSICLDAFPAAVAPGVSAPAARGIAPDLALSLLARVLERARHGEPQSRVVLAEVAELAPGLDPDGRTARLGARLVYDVVSPLL
ncbi:MAG: formimidoylglutamase [Steroidobacteraceae bacterium]